MESPVTALPLQSLFYPIHSRTTVQRRTPALIKSPHNATGFYNNSRDWKVTPAKLVPLAKTCRAHGCEDLTEERAPAG